tara:strand:- start:106 stop:279 length:174 start_codon:yes stop_codon:yes gene_type:complete
MESILPAIIGATASALLMMLANISNRRERDIREIFRRLSQIEKELAQVPKPRRLRVF